MRAPALLLTVATLAGCQEPIDLDDPLDGLDPNTFAPDSFTVTEDHLAIVVDGEVQPFFAVGHNLGVGIPGKQPGDLALDYDTYMRWFQLMVDGGANAVRIYTLHYPRFYEALRDFNEGRQDPLYVLHGIWLKEEVPDHDLFALTDDWDEQIEQVINAAHGDEHIAHRFGEAYGDWTVDISPWVLGWVIGREVDPWEIDHTLSIHEPTDHYDGQYVDLPEGNPLEVWLAERIDHVVAHEREMWGVTRPISFSSWPTLDPLQHRTEPLESPEDWHEVSLNQIDMFDAPGGYFATYHAYPYYPDFISDDPDYQAYEDEWGPNSYLGYLDALAEHYSNWPLNIGEFGVPSSWGNAHFGHNGMHHGGHDEVTQGEMGARMLHNFDQLGISGGMWFAWMDEWWKQSWITNEIEFPREHRPRYLNHLGPEQNYGVVAFDEVPTHWGTWEPLPGDGPIAEVQGSWKASDFLLRIELDEPLQPDERVTIGFDTYRDDLGESVLPTGEPAGRRVEYALVVEGSGAFSQLYVVPEYDTWGIWHAQYHDVLEPEQVFHSVASDSGQWKEVWWMNDMVHVSREGVTFPATEYPVGALQTRRPGDPPSTLDYVRVTDERIDINVPWTLLGVVDPTEHHVMHDDPSTPDEREVAVTDGIAVVVLRGSQRVVGPRWLWEKWTEPPQTVERLKPSYDTISEAMRELAGPR